MNNLSFHSHCLLSL